MALNNVYFDIYLPVRWTDGVSGKVDQEIICPAWLASDGVSTYGRALWVPDSDAPDATHTTGQLAGAGTDLRNGASWFDNGQAARVPPVFIYNNTGGSAVGTQLDIRWDTFTLSYAGGREDDYATVEFNSPYTEITRTLGDAPPVRNVSFYALLPVTWYATGMTDPITVQALAQISAAIGDGYIDADIAVSGMSPPDATHTLGGDAPAWALTDRLALGSPRTVTSSAAFYTAGAGDLYNYVETGVGALGQFRVVFTDGGATTYLDATVSYDGTYAIDAGTEVGLQQPTLELDVEAPPTVQVKLGTINSPDGGAP